MAKSILMVIAPQEFRDEELLVPKSIFEKAGFKVTIASKTTAEATGMLGAKVKPQIELNKVKPFDYDAVIFVGGFGTEKFKTYEDADYLNLAKTAAFSGKLVAAICLAPKILASAGLLKGKMATAYESCDFLENRGAKYTNKAVESDKFVTANGPAAASDFAKKVLEMLK